MKPNKLSPKQKRLGQQAFVLHQTGRLAEAAKKYEKLLTFFPQNPQLLTELGVIEIQQGNTIEGLKLLGKSLEIEPNQSRAFFSLGIGLTRLKRLDEALACYDQALALKPDDADAYNNRGIALLDLKQLDEALASFDRVLALKPDDAEAHSNRGYVLRDLNRWDEALASYDRALALKPDDAGVYYNRGIALQDLKRLDEALASYDRALALKPDYVSAYWNKSLLKLLMGDYEEGWKLYEWRWQNLLKDLSRNFTQPLWLGEQSVHGKTLLIHEEQGLGDVIQFCRYAPMAEALGAKIVLELPAALISLASTLNGNFTLVEKGEPLPDFDLHCPIMSLPLAFKTTLETIPANVPYLYADENKLNIWHHRLGNKTTLRVGLVWSGSKSLKNDQRSIPLELLGPLLQLPIEFHSLQKEVSPDDAAVLSDFKQLHCHHDELGDFSDTAGLVSEMDLVISIDTSVAHLAGALGKSVWILLPFMPDYRWMLDRADCPWYPSATLFRQPVFSDWSSVISEIVERLMLMLPST